MNSFVYSVILMLPSSFRTRARMQLEILALRHQLAVRGPAKRINNLDHLTLRPWVGAKLPSSPYKEFNQRLKGFHLVAVEPNSISRFVHQIVRLSLTSHVSLLQPAVGRFVIQELDLRTGYAEVSTKIILP